MNTARNNRKSVGKIIFTTHSLATCVPACLKNCIWGIENEGIKKNKKKTIFFIFT